MKGFIIGLLLWCAGSFASSVNVLNVHVMVLYTSIGSEANYSYIRELAPLWEDHVNSQAQFPFKVTVEMYETASNCTLISTIMERRLRDNTLPNITAIVTEGDECYSGALSSTIAAAYGVPVILTNYNPDSVTNDFRMPPSQNTSFLINPATFFIYRQLIASYLNVGVKTVVAVAAKRGISNNKNEHACFGAADWMETRGIHVKERYLIGKADSTPRVIEIINEIKKLKPDAVLWCDRAACQSFKKAAEFLPLRYFKDANYLPKTLSLINCLSSEVIETEDRALMLYVSEPNFINRKILGFEYTEENTPFSSKFRPSLPRNFSAIDHANTGRIPSIPPSTLLFYDWFTAKFGIPPRYRFLLLLQQEKTYTTIHTKPLSLIFVYQFI
jgi:hypothetical protein